MPTKQKPAGVADPTPVRAEVVASLAGEVWKPVVGYDGIYEVSSLGRVKSLTRYDASGHRRNGRLLALAHYQGYPFVNLNYTAGRYGRNNTRRVHRLVLEAFVGPCPDGMECCHNNGIRDDNRVENLRWDTHAGNQADKVAHGTIATPVRNDKKLLGAVRRMMNAGESYNRMAERIGVSYSRVADAALFLGGCAVRGRTRDVLARFDALVDDEWAGLVPLAELCGVNVGTAGVALNRYRKTMYSKLKRNKRVSSQKPGVRQFVVKRMVP